MKKTTTVTCRIDVIAMATLTQYFYNIGVTSHGSVMRKALELFADLLVQEGKVTGFVDYEEAIAYLQSFSNLKDVGTGVGDTFSLTSLPVARDPKADILGAIANLKKKEA